MTDTRRWAINKRVPYIQYLIQFFQKNNEDKNKDMKILIDSSSKVKVMHPVYVTKLGFYTRKMDFPLQKIDRSCLDTFGIVIVDYSVKDKLKKIWFFKTILLLTNISWKMVLGMLFLTSSRADVWFPEWEYFWRTYIAKKVLPMTKRVEIIDQNVFAVAALNLDDKNFIVHEAAIAEQIIIPIYPFCQAKLASLTSEQIEISVKYSEFFNIFSSDSAVKLPENTKINDHLINLLDNKQPPYSLMYSLGLVKLETLKTYIKANPASSFIRPSKYPAGIPIIFIQKKNSSLCLCVDYQGLNNLTIKNCYSLHLIGKLLDCLGFIKRFV